jgi:hypothetical protein
MGIFVIIVNYNGSNDTIECLSSIVNSNYDNISVVIVDNQSSNDEFNKLQSIKYNFVKILRMNYNVGFGVANNIGVDYAVKHGADYILLLNNDTIIKENMIEELVKYADLETIVVPSMYYFNEKNRLWYAGGKISRIKGTAQHYTSPQKKGYITFATGCCILLHRSIVEKYGLFDENYFMYHEDTDLSIKLVLHGIKIFYNPHAILWHKVGMSSNKIKGLQEYYIDRNRLYLMRKYKEYFYFTSYIYFILTRILKIFIRVMKGDSISYMLSALNDFKKNKMGKKFFAGKIR